ncbi:peptidyl-tRNA hydrolase protein 1 [Blastocladiella emersonii ATCC 22665]|nr:peptidyl-tRNA hydrolase protein 1 [Blastocladiella emersonii ATCC 22665]
MSTSAAAAAPPQPLAPVAALYIVGLGNHGAQYRTTRHNVGVLALEELADRLGLEWERCNGYDVATCSHAALANLLATTPGALPGPKPRKVKKPKQTAVEGSADAPALPVVAPPLQPSAELRLIRLRTFMNISGEKFKSLSTCSPRLPTAPDHPLTRSLPSLVRKEGVAAADFKRSKSPAASRRAPVLFLQDDLDKPIGTLGFKFTGSAAGHNGIKSIQSLVQSEAVERLKIGIGRPLDKADVANFVLKPFPKADREALDTAVFPATWSLVREWATRFEVGDATVPPTVKVAV